MKAEIDVETLTVSVNGSMYSLNGISQQLFAYLALKGLAAELKRRKDPVAAWKHMKAGRLDGRPEGKPDPLKDAYAQAYPGKAMPRALSRREIRRDPLVKAALLRAQADRLERGSAS